MQNLLPYDGEVFYFPAFFTAEESQFFMSQLLQAIQFNQEFIRLFGKSVLQPRLTAWVGQSQKAYGYSGLTLSAQDWTPTLINIKERIEPACGVTFTNALLNVYRDGQDSMGWHRDNEPELGLNPVIASVSLGERRCFKLRHRQSKQVISLDLMPGSVLVMQGLTQQAWEHSLPKTKAIKKMRLNLTFRVIFPDSYTPAV